MVQIDLAAVANVLKTVADEIIAPALAHNSAQVKEDGSVVTEVDHAVQEKLQQRLAKILPQVPLLGEEMTAAEQQQLQGEEYCWCLDPIDGTTNFATGIPFCAASLALLHHGQPVLAWTYDPFRAEMFSAQLGEGVQLNGETLRLQHQPDDLAAAVANVDFKRLDERRAHLLAGASPCRSLRNFGSCALEWCWLAAGRLQLYCHGGMKLWDYAAGSLILAEAGGYASTLTGEAVNDASFQTRSVVAATSQSLMRQWCAFLDVPSVAKAQG